MICFARETRIRKGNVGIFRMFTRNSSIRMSTCALTFPGDGQVQLVAEQIHLLGVNMQSKSLWLSKVVLNVGPDFGQIYSHSGCLKTGLY